MPLLWTAGKRKYRSFIVGSANASDPLLPFPVDPGTGGERHDRPFPQQALAERPESVTKPPQAVRKGCAKCGRSWGGS
jgi:hypothetical protein